MNSSTVWIVAHPGSARSLLRLVVGALILTACGGGGDHDDAELDALFVPLRVPGDGSDAEATACLASPASEDPEGSRVNRFLWCQRARLAFDESDTHLVYEAIAYGRDDSARNLTLLFRVRELPEGELPQDASLRVDPECRDVTPAGSESACTLTGAAVQRSLAEWSADRAWHRWQLESDGQKSSAHEKILRHTFRLHFELSGSLRFVGGASEQRSSAQPFRCDSQAFTNRTAACTLDGDPPVLTYSVNDERVREVALHIRTALTTPDETWPTASDKSIPGGYGDAANRPLHRVPYKSETWKENGAEKDRACRRTGKYSSTGLPAEHYDPPDQDCDEYPFASTKEGASNEQYDFSVLGVKKGHNRCAGNELKTFYLRERILYKDDPFYVRITDEPSEAAGACTVTPDAEPADELDDPSVSDPPPELEMTSRDLEPRVSAGPKLEGHTKEPLQLEGSVQDEGAVRIHWTHDAPASYGCSFDDPFIAQPRFTCSIAGPLFTLTISADDGVNPPVSARTRAFINDYGEAGECPTTPEAAAPNPNGAPLVITATTVLGGTYSGITYDNLFSNAMSDRVSLPETGHVLATQFFAPLPEFAPNGQSIPDPTSVTYRWFASSGGSGHTALTEWQTRVVPGIHSSILDPPRPTLATTDDLPIPDYLYDPSMASPGYLTVKFCSPNGPTGAAIVPIDPLTEEAPVFDGESDANGRVLLYHVGRMDEIESVQMSGRMADVPLGFVRYYFTQCKYARIFLEQMMMTRSERLSIIKVPAFSDIVSRMVGARVRRDGAPELVAWGAEQATDISLREGGIAETLVADDDTDCSL